MVYVWLSVALLCLLFEMGHPGLFLFLSFFFGALATAGVSVLSPDLVVQGAAFLLSSAVSLWVLRAWIKTTHRHIPKTNVHAMQGKRGKVITSLEPHEMGTVKVGGQVWSARSLHNDQLSVDTLISVVHVKGAHLIVEKYSDNNKNSKESS